MEEEELHYWSLTQSRTNLLGSGPKVTVHQWRDLGDAELLAGPRGCGQALDCKVESSWLLLRFWLLPSRWGQEKSPPLSERVKEKI